MTDRQTDRQTEKETDGQTCRERLEEIKRISREKETDRQSYTDNKTD